MHSIMQATSGPILVLTFTRLLHSSTGKPAHWRGACLGDEALLVRGQLRVHHVVGDVLAQLHAAAVLAGEVALQHGAGVDEPEVPLHALQPAAPGRR